MAANFPVNIDTHEQFSLVTKFYGYRSREDKTTLPPGWLVRGAENVLIDISGRLKSRQGYTLDGQANTGMYYILNSFDWEEHKNETIHVRNPIGRVDWRYTHADGTVTWETLITGMSQTQPTRFCNFWLTAELINVMLFVTGDTNIYEWSGGHTTLASVTAGTITKQGTSTWAELGFYVSTAGKKYVTINGTDYNYTGGEGTTTLTGVTPDPTLGGYAAGTLIVQKPYTLAAGSATAIPTTYTRDLISCLLNQIYLGSNVSNEVYISKVNDYTNFTYTTPVRIVGEGAKVTLRAFPTAFVPQESSMYISAGQNQWYYTKKILSSDNAKETFDITPLKSANNQGSRSPEAVGKDKNNVIFVSYEPVLTSLGRVAQILETPQLGDYSWPIVSDFNSYDFTGVHTFYFKNYIYVAVPAEGLVLVYNQTDPQNPFWEAPQRLPVRCFSVIDGELYGHSSVVDETYKLFTGYNDNGAPILSRATFGYQRYTGRGQSATFQEFFVCGYIDAGGTLTTRYTYDLDGCATEFTKQISGSDTQIVCVLKDDASLGKAALGKHGLGTSSTLADPLALPPYFNVILTSTPSDFFQVQYSFESYQADFSWQLLAFGPLVKKSLSNNASIKQ